VLVVAIGCLGVAIGAASYALTRTGARRLVAAVVAILALAAPLGLIVAYGRLLQLLLLLALVALAGAATRHALGRDLKSLTSGPTPGAIVGPAIRPVLLMNPRSGGGKVERFHLVQEARRRGIEPVVLAPGDDLLRLAEEAVAGGADVIGMAGGDGSQALVATVASKHDVGFVCVPAGTRNHLAMDLGLDRADVVGALDAFADAVERRIDLGMVDELVFVNNATVGLYAKIVQSPAYRDHKVDTALELLPTMLGPDAAPFDLRFTGPDGSEHQSAHLILVSNNRYELSHPEGFGSRRRLDAGTLGIVAARLQSPGEAASFARTQASGPTRRPSDWVEWTDTSFQVRSGQPVEVGVDGEAMLLDPPIRFRIVPGALRVRIPPQAPGYSPAAAVPTPGWATLTALWQTATGRPVIIEP
ncbi:MAG: diacylglycerol kinase, partial [Actinomycetota bacterium]|nr:diacylglycerol kinase [Actinomycetota bacterium]